MENTTPNLFKIRDDKNVIFADFLGWEKQNAGKYIIPDFLIKESQRIYADLRCYHELEFHSDWNWLMLVIEKIETTVFDFSRTDDYLHSNEMFMITPFKLIRLNIEFQSVENGWFYKLKVENMSMLISYNHQPYLTKKECAVEACWEFIEYLKTNNVKY